MKLMKASYRIDDMPDGEEALAKIERLGRIAYKSEGLIDDGIGSAIWVRGSIEEETRLTT